MLLGRKSNRGKIDVFLNNEEDYEAWLANHPNGFVFQHYKGTQDDIHAKFNKLHRAECTILHRPIDEGKRTRIEKICARDFKTLEKEAIKLRDQSWSTCPYCFR